MAQINADQFLTYTWTKFCPKRYFGFAKQIVEVKYVDNQRATKAMRHISLRRILRSNPNQNQNGQFNFFVYIFWE